MEACVETKIENLEDNKIKVSVTIDAADVDAQIKRTYKEYARKYSFPGFRKGKAPRPVVDNALGSGVVLADVSETLVNDAYPLVVESERLYPVGSPEFEDDDASLVEDGTPYTFAFTLSVKPEVELSSYDPVEVELPVSGTSDAEVEEQIKAMREHYITYEDAPDDAALAADGYAGLAIKATDGQGSAIDAIESPSRLYGLGTDMFSPAFDDEIRGMKKGETRKFTLDVPEDESSVLLSGQAGAKVNFEVTCNAVKEQVVPELTDEWAKETMGFEDVADLRQQVVDSLTAQKEEVLPRIKENACTAELIKRVEGDIPESMVEDAEQNLLQDFYKQLQQQGMNFDTYLMQENLTPDQFKDDVKQQASDEAKEQLALDAWARHAGIDATDEDVSAEFAKAGVDDPDATEKEWRESGRLYLIREGIVRSKAMDDVLDSAEVTEVDYAALVQEEAAGAQEAGSDEASVRQSDSDEESAQVANSDEDDAQEAEGTQQADSDETTEAEEN